MTQATPAPPQVEHTSTEEYMLEPVPVHARRQRWSMFVIWVGFGYVPTGLIVGGQLAGQGDKPGMNFPSALFSIAVGEGLLLLLTVLLGVAAMRTGLNLSLISRISYGKKGMILPMLIMAMLTLGWFASIVGMVGSIFDVAVGDLTGITVFRGLSLEYVLLCLFWGAVFTWSAWRGIEIIERISGWAAPFVLVVAVVAAILMVSEYGGIGAVLAEASTRSGMSQGTGVTIMLGAWIAGVIMGVDIFRYAGNNKHVWVGAAACFVLTNPLLNIVGYLGAIATGDSNFITWMAVKGALLTVTGVILWVLALWTTNMSELYCNALYVGPAAESMGWRVRRGKIVIVVGTIGTIAGSLGFYSYFFADFITILGAAFVPLAGPILADYFFIRRKEYATANPNEMPPVRWPALISFVIGAVAGVIFQYWLPLPWNFPAGFAALILTFILHIVLSRVMQHRPEQQQVVSAHYDSPAALLR
ncbi:cytosine permease [Corynebacterium felinum]|uniref:Cytosine permease n=1 Tax=Corynebacterium felinum TaxID=131318 RepID=A0ABU2B5W2_9CORY|nr:cytosine permease [Corynebacterium felinum]MDF5821489.1 cytosine permease [Corynebacterium felinum]MDR7354007.1 cytosine permease [Corynebacterium felinum]WJY96181.1 Cytosine permease [Corynebacterium felinum]